MSGSTPCCCASGRFSSPGRHRADVLDLEVSLLFEISALQVAGPEPGDSFVGLGVIPISEALAAGARISAPLVACGRANASSAGEPRFSVIAHDSSPLLERVASIA